MDTLRMLVGDALAKRIHIHILRMRVWHYSSRARHLQQQLNQIAYDTQLIRNERTDAKIALQDALNNLQRVLNG